MGCVLSLTQFTPVWMLTEYLSPSVNQNITNLHLGVCLMGKLHSMRDNSHVVLEYKLMIHQILVVNLLYCFQEGHLPGSVCTVYTSTSSHNHSNTCGVNIPAHYLIWTCAGVPRGHLCPPDLTIESVCM